MCIRDSLKDVANEANIEARFDTPLDTKQLFLADCLFLTAQPVAVIIAGSTERLLEAELAWSHLRQIGDPTRVIAVIEEAKQVGLKPVSYTHLLQTECVSPTTRWRSFRACRPSARISCTPKARDVYKGQSTLDEQYTTIETLDGMVRRLTTAEIAEAAAPPTAKRFMPSSLYSDSGGKTTSYFAALNGASWQCLPGYFWRTSEEGMRRLIGAGRITAVGRYLRYKMYSDDYPVVRVTNLWNDVRAGGYGEAKIYVVQTNVDVIARCILMATDPGDLVLDPTCGSGTTGYVAEYWGRRWITMDTSRVCLLYTSRCV